MVKNHARKLAAATTWATLNEWHINQVAARVLLYAQSSRHTIAFVTPVEEHWLEQEIVQWVPMKDRSNDPSHHEHTLCHGVGSHWVMCYRHLLVVLQTPTCSATDTYL